MMKAHYHNSCRFILQMILASFDAVLAQRAFGASIQPFKNATFLMAAMPNISYGTFVLSKKCFCVDMKSLYFDNTYNFCYVLHGFLQLFTDNKGLKTNDSIILMHDK